eukprot:m.218996 g.218996  ORF g.218996 m.218996 type:complete len:426 (+) comp15911_c0_seq2:239-1516(+)
MDDARQIQNRHDGILSRLGPKTRARTNSDLGENPSEDENNKRARLIARLSNGILNVQGSSKLKHTVNKRQQPLRQRDTVSQVQFTHSNVKEPLHAKGNGGAVIGRNNKDRHQVLLDLVCRLLAICEKNGKILDTVEGREIMHKAKALRGLFQKPRELSRETLEKYFRNYNNLFQRTKLLICNKDVKKKVVNDLKQNKISISSPKKKVSIGQREPQQCIKHTQNENRNDKDTGQEKSMEMSLSINNKTDSTTKLLTNGEDDSRLDGRGHHQRDDVKAVTKETPHELTVEIPDSQNKTVWSISGQTNSAGNSNANGLAETNTKGDLPISAAHMKNFIRETNSAKPTTLQASGVRGMVPRAVKAKLAKKTQTKNQMVSKHASFLPLTKANLALLPHNKPALSRKKKVYRSTFHAVQVHVPSTRAKSCI